MKTTLCELPDNNPPSEKIKNILRKYKKIAITGLSPKESRDSNRVARYLMEHGYEIIPVNPGQKEILGKPCFKTIRDIPFRLDMVNIFLNPERVPPVVDQAIEIGVGAIWMQLGIRQEESAQKAMAEGIEVIMNKCIMKEHIKLLSS